MGGGGENKQKKKKKLTHLVFFFFFCCCGWRDVTKYHKTPNVPFFLTNKNKFQENISSVALIDTRRFSAFIVRLRV